MHAIGLDKQKFWAQDYKYFLTHLTYVLGAQKNRLIWVPTTYVLVEK